MATATPRFELLDLMRGLAAILVVAYHYVGQQFLSGPRFLLSFGYLAVDFFFRVKRCSADQRVCRKPPLPSTYLVRFYRTPVLSAIPDGANRWCDDCVHCQASRGSHRRSAGGRITLLECLAVNTVNCVE